MHDNLRDAITREVLAYYSASDSIDDTITFAVIVDRDEHTWRVRSARKMLCLMLRDRAGMSIVEIAAYIDRTLQTVDYHIKDIAMSAVVASDTFEWERDIRNITGRLLKYGGFNNAEAGARTPTPLYAGRRDRRGLHGPGAIGR